MITINELIDELVQAGYKITPRTVKYYIELGILPKPGKEGGYREGVRLVFPDRNETISRLKRIFELKGRGFKLHEIGEILKDEKQRELNSLRKKELKKFVERDGRFYFLLNPMPMETRYVQASSLGEALVKFNIAKPDENAVFNEVESRGLYLTPYLHKRRLVYDSELLIAPISWVELNQQYGLDFDLLEVLFKKHAENMDSHFQWPNPDDIRFTKTWVGYHRQWALNWFACDLATYVRGISEGFWEVMLQELDPFPWHFIYKNLQEFIDDFIVGHCAFVPQPYVGSGQGLTPIGGPALFLKKF